MKWMRRIVWVCAAWLSFSVQARVTHLLPVPKSVVVEQRKKTIQLRNRLVCEELPSPRIVRAFHNLLGQTLTTEGKGIRLEIKTGCEISEAYDYVLADYPNEAYRLTVGEKGIRIEATTETGVIRAVQTLAQMAEGTKNQKSLEACTIVDWPAFKLRGWMHDIGRSYISVEELKRQIRLFGRFKVNALHLHLTENQAWRFEVKRYPQLTEAGSMVRFPGKYYTQEECKELVQLAADYGITVIPEIDMPGHSEAFERAMEHSMQTDSGVEELKAILDEVCEVFAEAPYIHIGADDQQITYPGFLQIFTDYLHERGKRVVVWNPIRGVVITNRLGADMTQMWSTAGRTVSGLPNIDCRYNYINHFDVFADLVGIYKSNIYYAQQGSQEVAGEITATWNDRLLTEESDIMRQNNLYANVLASTARAWKGGGLQYIEKGGTTLPDSGPEFEDFADWERRFLFHKAHSLREVSIPYVRQTDVRWQVAYEREGMCIDTLSARGAGVYLRHTWGNIVPGLIPNPQPGMTAHAWTYVYSPVKQMAGAVIEFQNYGRSENDRAPNDGCWDRKGSRIWLNDEEIPEPVWTNAGKKISGEVPLANENFTARPPLPVVLQKGWNKVQLFLPYVPADGIRLNKWMFTFVLTDLSGRDALDGLIYSPDKEKNKHSKL